MVKRSAPKESTQQKLVRCDLEFPPLQDEIDELSDADFSDLEKSIVKIQQMTWQQVFETSSKGLQKRGINWEVLPGQVTARGRPIASIRITRKHRARVTREGEFMRFISLHPDHDGAYEEEGGEDL